MTKELIELIPKDLLNVSGSVFYSGKEAFTGNKPLYILGLNPGGDVERQAYQTINHHNEKNLGRSNWSEYVDEVWNSKEKGKSTVQRRVRHLLNNLELTPSEIPASNVVFKRTKSAKDLGSDFWPIADLCWSFHQHLIRSQNIKNILCFGQVAGKYVKGKLKCNELIDVYVEANNRKWKTRVYSNSSGINVIIATHPSWANWCNPKSDPSKLIKKNMVV